MSLAPLSNSAISAACCIDWPIGALRPDSGSRRAIRVLPEGVTGEPVCTEVVGGGGAMVDCGGDPQALSRKPRAASAKKVGRIGTELRRNG